MSERNDGFQVRPGGGPMHMGHFHKKSEKIESPWITSKRIIAYMGHNRLALILTFLLCIITAAVSIFGTRLNGYAVDEFIETGDFTGLYRICIVLLVIYAVGVVATFIQNLLTVRIAQTTSNAMRKALYDKLQKLSIRYFDTHGSGDLMSRLTNDIDNISMMLSQNLTQLFSGVVLIIGMAIAMLLLSPILFGVGILTMPLILFLTKIIVRIAQPYFVKQQREIGAINSFIEEQISGQKAILLFGREAETREQFEALNMKWQKSALFAQGISGVLGPINNLVNNLTYFLVAVTGAYLLLKGYAMTTGIIFTFILYMRNFIRPINQIMNMFSAIQSALAGAERVFEIIDEPGEFKAFDESEAIPLQGEVIFEHVHFSYDTQTEILKDIDIQAYKGQTIAIVGPTGSGKTTIINLLTRFYDINQGDIRLDDISIQTYPKRALRQSVAMVLQDTFLFSDTVAQNIRYGNIEASQQDIERAARVANAHTFITQLPKGYDTILTDNGSNLSQGQRQLLAIARAVLSESAILVLDEATSSIDTQTEIEIQKAMLELMKGKTTFIIAHRLSTIKNADVILALKDGKIIEKGNHDALMAADGFYAQLCKTQYKGFEI